MKLRVGHLRLNRVQWRACAIFLAVFTGGALLAHEFGLLGSSCDWNHKTRSFLVASDATKLNGFIQTSMVHTRSTYRVNFRGSRHRLSTVAISESRDQNSLSQSHCKNLPVVKSTETAIPFELSAGHGVVFNHQVLLANGAQTGWMQLLLDNQGTCVEISAKGLAAGELQPQDLILMVASLEPEIRQ